MPNVSVIVPVYKVEPYLRRCIDSILCQSYENFELILVDDGSPDNCGNICEEYAARDGRIHVIHQENGGLSAARNAGIDWVFANSGSSWFTFIDSDDWVHQEMLERLLDAAVSQNVKISVCGYEETPGHQPEIIREAMQISRWTPKDFYMTHFVNATVAWGKLYHRSCFEEARYPVGKIHEDEYLTYRILFKEPALAVIPAPMYAYFLNASGIIRSSWSPKRLHAWQAYEEQIAYFRQLGDEELVSFRIRGYYENAVANLQKAENAPNAEELAEHIVYMKKTLRKVIRRAWKAGCIQFWLEFDILYRFYPIQTRIYRLWLEIKSVFRREGNA